MRFSSRIVGVVLWLTLISTSVQTYGQPAPTPLAGPGKPVDWLFVFKFNSATYPDQVCNGGDPKEDSPGVFGGTVKPYKKGEHSQQYAFATSKNPTLVRGDGCVGATLNDPLGATFAQVYNNPGYFYVLWNDQFYGNPISSKSGPAGHSKGMVVWNAEGNGFVMQVSTPSWPGAGSKTHPRLHDGNTLGCINDDDVEVSQHFFVLKITKPDLITILEGLANASVVTAVDRPVIVQSGGPDEVQKIVKTLGPESESTHCTMTKLSTGVQFISKPSKMPAPPWQLVSGKLDGLPLRVASWWTDPMIYSTNANTKIEGWPVSISNPGPVAIATSGTWDGKQIGLAGGEGPNFNHAKIGVSTDKTKPFCIFGDLNQQGALRTGYAHPGQPMTSSQNGRGGTFYVLENQKLFDSLTDLLKGSTAPEDHPNGVEKPRPSRRK